MIEPYQIVKRILERRPSGVSGFIVDLVKYDSDPNVVFLRIYRDNFELLSDSDRELIANSWIPDVIQWAQAAGVIVYLEVEEFVPNWNGDLRR